MSKVNFNLNDDVLQYYILCGGRGAGRYYKYNKEKEMQKQMDSKNEKIKVTEAEIIVTGTKEKPYYQIRYHEVDKDNYNIGFGSYYLNLVFDWLDEEFEIVKVQNENEEEKVNCMKKEDLERRLSFEFDFCSECPDRRACKNVYDSIRCKVLFNALKDNGFIEESVQKEKMVQLSVNMDEMRHNIMIELLNARKEAVDKNILSATGFVSIIDTLFYLVKERPIIPTFCADVDMGDLRKDKKYICTVAHCECTMCTPGPCESRREVE